MRFTKELPSWIKELIKKGFFIVTGIFTILSVVTAIISFPPVDSFRWLYIFVTNIANNGNIFSITLALYAIIYVAFQLEEAAIANKLANKQTWTTNLKEVFKTDRYIKAISSKPYALIIQNYFIAKQKRDEMFEFLFNINTSLQLKDKKELGLFFDEFIKDKISVFEDFGPDEPQSTYQEIFNLVNEIIISILEPATNYKALEKDFAEFYFSASKLVK